jgi:integrase/recombinase XerD
MITIPANNVETDHTIIAAWSARCQTVSSQRSYRRYAENLLKYTKKSLQETDKEDIKLFYHQHLSGKLSTRCTALSAIKSLFSYLFENGYIKTNPADAVVMPKERFSNNRSVVLYSDIERMFVSELNERNYAILRLAYSGGLVVSELANLKWENTAELPCGTAIIRVAGYRSKWREIQISESCWKAISALRGHAKPAEPVFVSKKGGHMSPSAIHRVVKAAAIRVGLPDSMSVYWLRHAQTSHSIDSGASLLSIQLKLGHSDINTTKRYVSGFVYS